MSAKPVGGLAQIPLTEIRVSPDNPRENLTDIDDLAASIAEQGLLQPLLVQRVPSVDGYQVIAGHRRLAALQNLGRTHALCIVRRELLPDEELLAMIVENGQRAGLDPIEEARAFRRLHRDMGLSVEDVANKVGRSKHTVQKRLMLLDLPPAEQEKLRAGASTLNYAEAKAREAKADVRVKANPIQRPIGRPKGATTKPYFGSTHPLADKARCGCIGRPKLTGGVACGPCWETAIRGDAVANISPVDTQERAS